MDVSPSTLIVEDPPQRADHPFWNYTDLLIVIGLSCAFAALLLGVFGTLRAFVPAVKRNVLLLALPMQLLLYGLVYVAFRITFGLRYRRPVFESLGWCNVRFNVALVAVGGVALAFVVAGLASALHPPQVPSPFEKLLGSPLSILMFVVFAVIVGPVTEELVFRGFIQPLLSRTFGVASGIVATALIFGALHGPEYSGAWQYIVAVSLAGLAFGWMRARLGSVIPSTLMHGCYNAVFVVAFFVARHAKHT